MEYPYTAQNDATGNDAFQTHHNEANTHQQGYRDHDAHLCFHVHTATGHKVFQIIFIKLCVLEPMIQLFGGSGKTECSQHQKRKGGQHGNNGTNGTQTNTDASKDNIAQIKKVAVDLLAKVKAKIAELDHWSDKPETKAIVDNLIRDTLWAELPESYDEVSITTYRKEIYEYIYLRYKTAA